jgi:hypothetical protein
MKNKQKKYAIISQTGCVFARTNSLKYARKVMDKFTISYPAVIPFSILNTEYEGTVILP